MNKIGPKSVRTAAPSKGKILYCEIDAKVLSEQSRMFERAGYTVETTVGRGGAVQSLLKNHYDLVVLGHTLTKDDRHHLAYMAKKSSEATQVLVLHASGKHPAVDFAMDSRQGEKAIITALDSLSQTRATMAS